MKGTLRLRKGERLCSRTQINRLFGEGSSVIAYPLRAVYLFTDAGTEPRAQFMITIPKKKIRRAVHRVLLRRRVREAYRLSRHLIVPALEQNGKSLMVAFVWLSDEIAPYDVIEGKLQEILTRISNQ